MAKVKEPPTLSTNQAVIVSLQADGYGVGNKGEIIPFALPGEEVEYDKLHYRRHARVHRVEALKASEGRTAPLCPHYTQHHPTHCGGCTLQHMSAATASNFKHWKVQDAFQRHGIDPLLVSAPITVGYGLRRRTNMEGILKPDGLSLGFHRMQSHSILNMTECHTLIPSLVALVEPLRCMLPTIMQLYQKAQVFMLQADNVLDLVLTVQGVNYLDDEAVDVCQKWAMEHSVRLTYKHGKHRTIIYEPQGPATIVWGGVAVEVTADSFVQPTMLSDKILAEHLDMPSHIRKVVDLFCGRGTLALTMASRGLEVTGVEWDAEAVEALSRTGRLLGVVKRQLFDNPLTAGELNQFDAVTINPPRAGALAQVLACAESNLQYAVYVSCNPETAARDLAEWTKNGRFRIVSIQPVDQFAGSSHVELVAHVELNQ